MTVVHKIACHKNITNLVSHKRPFVQLEELLAVLAATSTCTKLYNCSYFAGSVSYFVCNLYTKYLKPTIIKGSYCMLSTLYSKTFKLGFQKKNRTVMLPPISLFTRDIADPNLSEQMLQI
jgi:hypothetical protein